MTDVHEFAYAKINLYLHVLGRRADGYHELDSLVVFANTGDLLVARPADKVSLEISGPFAAGLPTGPENLIHQAATKHCPKGRGVAVELTKNLPVAAGIGGGSADAAAALRALYQLYGVTPSLDQQRALGADVPMCMASEPARALGIGEDLIPAPDLPPFWVVLVNNGTPVSTGAVFQALDLAKGSKKLDFPKKFKSLQSFVDFLGKMKNDLTSPALSLDPDIAEALAALEASGGCHLARMSGSGGTCFGIFADHTRAKIAANLLKIAHPEWWVQAAAASHNP